MFGGRSAPGAGGNQAVRRIPRSLGRISGAQAVWTLTVAVAVAAAAVYFLLVAPAKPFGATPHVSWWLLAVAYVVAERCAVHIHFGRSGHTFTLGLSEVPLIFGLCFARPEELMLAVLVGSAVAFAVVRRLPPIKAAFNVAQFCLGTAVAIGVFTAIAAGPEVGPRAWAGAFAASLVFAGLGGLLVGAAMSLAQGGLRTRRLLLATGLELGVALANASLAAAAATVMADRGVAAALLLVPAAGVFLAYRGYVGERQRRETLSFLYETMRTVARSPESVPAMESMLRGVRDAFQADIAEILLLAPEGDARSVTSGPGDERQAPAAVGRSAAVELLDELGHGSPTARFTAPLGRTAADLHLAALGIEGGMLAALPGEARQMGVMLVANRVGVSGAFSTDELNLFEALANNASVGLQQERLGQMVGELRQLKSELEHRALHDPLTGLANRSLFSDRVEHGLARRDGGFTVLFCDLDSFKAINDAHGHHVGDAILVAVAERLSTCLRPADTAARFGGDEFAVLLEDILDAAEAMRVAERVASAVAGPFALGEETITVEASIGLASSDDALTATELIGRADTAMYLAKRAGKARIELFDPARHELLGPRSSPSPGLRVAPVHAATNGRTQ